jgi:divalent metal cation (Fe/Co/Zn/Cd) transporter
LDPSARSLSRAQLYCGLTVAWNICAGGASLIVGAATGSLALIAFGLDAAVDSIASSTLVWRFGQERTHAERGDELERTALRVVGATLVAIALYVLIQGIRSLAARSHPNGSAFGVVLAAASLLVLPLLAYRKMRLASVLQSRALRGDALLSAAGASLAMIALVGQLLNNLLGWWWADSVAALVIGLGLFIEGWRSLRSTHALK